MYDGKITTNYKLRRPITDSELLTALKESMHPIFAHLEEKLAEKDGQTLEISIAAEAGKVKLSYGVYETASLANARALQPDGVGVSEE